MKTGKAGIRFGMVAGLLVAVSVAHGQSSNPPTPDMAARLDQRIAQLQQPRKRNAQADVAARFYGLSAEQAGRLTDLLNERNAGAGQRTGAYRKLTAAVEAMQEAGVPFDEELCNAKAAALKSELVRFRAETRTRVREEILDDGQRRLFDAALADGNDPLSGEPADATLPNHDPAKFKAYYEARKQRRQEDSAVLQGLQRVFSGKGFVEAEWTAWLEKTAARTGMDERQRGISAEMLDMAKQAAADYRKAKEAAYAKVAADFAAFQNAPAADRSRRPAAEKAAAELAAPVDGIGKQFRQDVTDLLTDEQRKRLGNK